jgi:hypothetical protein
LTFWSFFFCAFCFLRGADSSMSFFICLERNDLSKSEYNFWKVCVYIWHYKNCL